MLTYSGLTVQDGQKEENIIFNAEAIKSKYPTIVADNYRYRGVVKNHNVWRHYGVKKSQIGLDSARGTTCWTIGVFDFFIECTEVN